MTERFKKAYNSLVRAFFEGTLAKFTCTACACGNIINDAMGTPMTKEMLDKEIAWFNDTEHTTSWKDVIERRNAAVAAWGSKRFCTSWLQGRYEAREEFESEINVAGYTTKEFAEIENAFEMNTEIHFHLYPTTPEQEVLEDQYKGLCAVVDVLMKLDEIPQGADGYKQEFRKHPKLVTV